MKEPHEASSFKLFGRTIQLSSAARSSGNTISSRPIIETSVQESPIREDAIESKQDTEPSSSHSNNDGNEPSSSKSESEKQDEETETGKEEEEPNGSRPVINRWLPCPRCESSDTKFCYFNNYNVNQPRHFCRKCQRYWTNGGNQRNLPVGSGRRKRKMKRDNNSKDQILNSLYGSSSSTSSVPSFVMSSSVYYGANNLDLHGLNGLLVWSNSRIPP